METRRSSGASSNANIPKAIVTEIEEEIDEEIRVLLATMPATPVGGLVNTNLFPWLGMDPTKTQVVGDASTDRYICEIKKLHGFLNLAIQNFSKSSVS